MKFDKGLDLRPLHPEVPEDLAVLTEVVYRIRDSLNPRGTALEFGVATGQTLSVIAQYIPVIGFDSFEGLPENWREDFPKGRFAGVRPPHEIPNSTLVEGWFNDTVPGYDWPDEISLVHIDCDLYSSTIAVLTELIGVVSTGTYIVFDEFFGYEGCEEHEQRAFEEFLLLTGLDYEVIGHGREQWAVRLV